MTRRPRILVLNPNSSESVTRAIDRAMQSSDAARQCQGIGRQATHALAQQGAKVLCVDYNLGSAEETVDMIKKNQGTAAAFKADVTKESEADVERYGKHDLDYLGLLQLACGLLWFRRLHKLQAA